MPFTVVLGPTAIPAGSGQLFPMSFNDPIFANVTNGTVGATYSNGQNDADKSWANANGGVQIFTMQGNNSFARLRIGLPTREGPRIAGSGTFTFDQCWIECDGLTGDHADGIQAFSPGDSGTLTCTNCTFRSYSPGDNPGGVGSDAIFLADNWTGKLVCHNVVFWGGTAGPRAYPDTGGDMHIDFDRVYAVGPFGNFFTDISSGTVIGGHNTIIDRWTNVFNATIVNGIVIPGSAIPSP